MVRRLLLISENSRHAETLHQTLSDMEFEVMHVDACDIGKVSIPFCSLAVLNMHTLRLEPVIDTLRKSGCASKLLALVPFHINDWEARLVEAGADDVLSLPVTRTRLEVTLHNLLKLYILERAGMVAYDMAV